MWRFAATRFSLLAVLTIGIFLRLPPAVFEKPALVALAPLHPQPKFTGVGVDESFYSNYVDQLQHLGVASFPDIVDNYIKKQNGLPAAILPPVRFLYIFCAYGWQSMFGTDPLSALHSISALFSILTLLLAFVFAVRLQRPGYGLGIAALMSFAPTQLHMSQHALIDGFFAFWVLLALWSLWENLCSPSWRWIVLYGCSLAALVLTKENALFVWLAIVAILVANRWLRIGMIKRELLYATGFGPAVGVAILVWLAGGVSTLIATYHLFITKNYTLDYSMLAQDGPWHRYIVDLLLVSPFILLLAIGSLFTLTRGKKMEWFCAIFILATYAMMGGIRYGMNLRFANMWDFPLRVLALSQLTALAGLFGRWRNIVLITAVAIICTAELRNYITLAVNYPLYDLVTTDLMRALQILKGGR